MILTGIKPTGTFHLGNFISTILPLIKMKNETIVLLADQHSLISNNFDINKNSIEITKIFNSFGFHNIIKQSELPEISELNWILSCYTEIGHLNRSHAYKSLKEYNIMNNFKENKGITAGLFNYPTLMTADNAIFDTEFVSIGQDQLSHIELAKFIVNKFNYIHKTNILKIPEPIVSDNTIYGYDGRKMSKSYNNIIPLMCSEKKLKKHIFKMKTNSKNIGEPKHFLESPVCDLFCALANIDERKQLETDMDNGISWGDVKQLTFDLLNNKIKEAREIYNQNYKDAYCNDFKQDIKLQVKEKLIKIKEIVY